MRLDGTLLVGSATQAASVAFQGNHSLLGTGRIVFGSSNNSLGPVDSANFGNSLTIGPQITFDGGRATFSGTTGGSVAFESALMAPAGEFTFPVRVSFNGQGGVSTGPDGALLVHRDLLGTTRVPPACNNWRR
jgi:hypothetical protein